MSGSTSSRSGNDFKRPRHLLRIHINPVGQTNLGCNINRALDTKLFLGLLANADGVALLSTWAGRNVNHLDRSPRCSCG